MNIPHYHHEDHETPEDCELQDVVTEHILKTKRIAKWLLVAHIPALVLVIDIVTEIL